MTCPRSFGEEEVGAPWSRPPGRAVRLPASPAAAPYSLLQPPPPFWVWGKPDPEALRADRGHGGNEGSARVCNTPSRAPAALGAAGGAPPPGPLSLSLSLSRAGQRHQAPRPAGEQRSDPEPQFHWRAGSGGALGWVAVRMRPSAASSGAGVGFWEAVGQEQLAGARS